VAITCPRGSARERQAQEARARAHVGDHRALAEPKARDQRLGLERLAPLRVE
jgi:hypothetical protein